VSTGADSLVRGLDAGWERGEPAARVEGWSARLDEIAALDPGVAGAVAEYGAAIAGAADGPTLTERFAAALGRERGDLTRALAELPSLALEQRRTRGRALNLAKRVLEDLADGVRAHQRSAAEAREALDVSLPGRRPWTGRRHVLLQIYDELLELFHGLGYSVYTSPEVERDEYNFGKLNFPPDHPARDAHDTYFVAPPDGAASGAPLPALLRTHTSPGWVRAMEERKPPLRLVFPGRVYRAEQIDASHMDQFHQIDGLWVDRNVSMADLKSTLNTFARALFGAKVRTRFIPIYFPFVEPGAQLDVSCVICGGEGVVQDGATSKRCSVCKGSGWLEVLGSGMVHPNVFRAVGYDPEEVTGFAFGMGIERIAMLRHGVPEIRLFLENDVRFLEQFR
jgi:phenylalanyl-tRNA synthetase alpha chain